MTHRNTNWKSTTFSGLWLRLTNALLLTVIGITGCDTSPKSKARYYQRNDKVRVTIVQRFEEPEVDLREMEESQPIRARVTNSNVTVEYPAGLHPLAETLARLVPEMAQFVEREFSVRWTWEVELRLVRVEHPPTKFVARRQHSRGTFRMVLFVPPAESLESVYQANRMFPHSFVHEMTELALAFPGESGNPVLLDYDSDDLREVHHTRWFRDGLASFIGERTAEEFCKSSPRARLHLRPFEALNRLNALLFEWTDSQYSMSEEFITRDKDFYSASMGFFYLLEQRHNREAVRDWVKSFEAGGLLNGSSLERLFRTRFGQSPAQLLSEWHPNYLGIRGTAVSSAIASSRGISNQSGLLVLEVAEGSPAHEAGIRAGDVIKSADGRAISTPDVLERRINAGRQSEYCELKLSRSGNEVSANVKVMQRPKDIGRQWL